MKRRVFLKNSTFGLSSILIPNTFFSSCNDGNKNEMELDKSKNIIVIGSGISGLASAKLLNDNGINVIVLESQDRLGGRLRTDRSLNIPFDEGASWIHGPIGNPISNIAELSEAITYLTNDENIKIYDTDGTEYNEDTLDEYYTAYENVLDTIQNNGSVDQSFEEVFKSLYPEYIDDRLWKFMLSAYLEFDTGADISQLSSLDFYDDESFSGNDVIITNGYDKIADYLAQGIDIRLNNAVEVIDYSSERVVVSTSESTFEADYVIITVPLGVLKNNIITFSPALPQEKLDAIDNVKMSAVNKFLLLFNTTFWNDNLQYFGYTADEKGKFNYFLNLNKFATGSNALMTFAFGNYGILTESMSDNEIIDLILTHLRNIYGSSVPSPINMLRTKWNTNVHTFGSYSFASNNTRSSDFDILGQKVGNSLFFAGEHTSKDYRGTVHGAYLSGINQADAILKLLST